MVCGTGRKLFKHIVAGPETFVLVSPITPRCLGITFFCTLYYYQVLIVIWQCIHLCRIETRHFSSQYWQAGNYEQLSNPFSSLTVKYTDHIKLSQQLKSSLQHVNTIPQGIQKIMQYFFMSGILKISSNSEAYDTWMKVHLHKESTWTNIQYEILWHGGSTATESQSCQYVNCDPFSTVIIVCLPLFKLCVGWWHVHDLWSSPKRYNCRDSCVWLQDTSA